MQDAELATRELTRSVTELGFKGALVNGFSQVNDKDTVAYYDAAQYGPFWAEVERLDVPFYLHPRNPLPRHAQIYDGHGWLMGPSWAFGQETAVHALRLMGSGLFDTHPRLKIILGHLGEGLPYSIWRVDHCNGWVKGRHKYAAKNKIADYFYSNFHLTTSGNFRTQSMIAAMMELGADKILFSADWPFEDVGQAAQWFDSATISEADRIKIGRTNALKLFQARITGGQRTELVGWANRLWCRRRVSTARRRFCPRRQAEPRAFAHPTTIVRRQIRYLSTAFSSHTSPLPGRSGATA